MVPLPEDLKLAIRADYESWLDSPYEPTAEDELPDPPHKEFTVSLLHFPESDVFDIRLAEKNT